MAGHVVNQWAPIEERGLFVAVISAYVELSALITMPLGGVIAIKGVALFFWSGTSAAGCYPNTWLLTVTPKTSLLK